MSSNIQSDDNDDVELLSLSVGQNDWIPRPFYTPQSCGHKETEIHRFRIQLGVKEANMPVYIQHEDGLSLPGVLPTMYQGVFLFIFRLYKRCYCT